MQKLTRIFSISILALFAFTADVARLNNEWELINENDGIKVYTRDIEGKDLKELKMSSTVNGQSLSSFVSLLHDLDSYDKWVYSFGEAKVLHLLSETEMIYYMRSDFPWPLSDRDFVVKNKIWQDSSTLAFHSHSIIHNNYHEEKDDCVRVKEFEAQWIITPTAKGEFQIEYFINTDPSGNIPSWLVNTFLDVGPLHTIEELEKSAKSELYKNASFSFIQEPQFN